MMKNISNLQAQYNSYLTQNQFSGSPENLYEPMNYIMSLGGKRIRPLLSMIGNQLFNGQPNHGLEIGHIMEVFHNFSLVHDDIMDKADLRRGNETVHIKWNMPTAILSGDNMLIETFGMLNTYLKTATEVCEGQQNDMDFESRDQVEIDDYLNMIQNKTAVLLGCSLKCGALSANANEIAANLLYDFAVNMGMAFQMMDDYLDSFGASNNTGKIQGGDIIQGKKTWLYLMSQQSNFEKHQEVFNLSDPNQKTNEVLSFWKSIQLDKQCLNLIQSYNSKALKDLDLLKSQGVPCEILEELLDYLGNRNS